jgi:Zn finger protein HypA/HybF involved in hydrogenase expression
MSTKISNKCEKCNCSITQIKKGLRMCPKCQIEIKEGYHAKADDRKGAGARVN